MPSVSPFHRFEERAAREILKWGWAIKIPKGLIPQNRETAKQTAFYSQISMTCLFQTV
jgi:hypothetical protein